MAVGEKVTLLMALAGHYTLLQWLRHGREIVNMGTIVM